MIIKKEHIELKTFVVNGCEVFFYITKNFEIRCFCSLPEKDFDECLHSESTLESAQLSMDIYERRDAKKWLKLFKKQI